MCAVMGRAGRVFRRGETGLAHPQSQRSSLRLALGLGLGLADPLGTRIVRRWMEHEQDQFDVPELSNDERSWSVPAQPLPGGFVMIHFDF